MGQVFKAIKQSDRYDSIGKFASGLCALHCAICALAPGVFALLGADLLLDHEAEWAFIIIAVIFALAASITGWMTHRSFKVVSFFLLGVFGLIASRFLEEAGGHELGAAVGISAGLCLLFAHLKNSSAAANSKDDCCDHSALETN